MAEKYFSARLCKIIIAASILAVPALCRATVKNPDTFVYAHMGEMVNLDPVYPYDGITQGMIFNVYETLVRFKRESLTVYEPVISSKVPSVKNGLITEHGTKYSFPIRKGIKFHDGTPLTPEDVRYSLLRFMLTDPAGGPASLLLEPILGVSGTRNEKGETIVDFKDAEKAVAVSGDNVVITLKRPFAPFLAIMARWSYVINKAWCIENGEWDGTEASWKKYNNLDKSKSKIGEKMNGSGPFKLERWDRKSKKVYLGRFDQYWGTPAQLKRIVLATVDEFGTRRLMLEAGDADIIDVPRTFESQLNGMPGVTMQDNLPRLRVDPVFFFTFKVNPSGNPDIGSGVLDGNGVPPDFFSDIDVRKGFEYSFDYEAFLNQSLKGKAVRAAGPVPPGVLGYNKNLPRYELNPKKAEEHFKKAFGGKVWERGFKVTVTYNTGGDVRQLACEILKKNVEAINPKFKITLRGLDWPSYLDRAQSKKMPLFSRGWVGDYPDPHNFVFPFYHTAGRYAASQAYSNPDMDQLIEQAVAATSNSTRAMLYDKIQKLGYKEAVHIYTVYVPGLYAMRSWVKGFYDNAVFMGVYYYPLYKSE